MDMFTQFYAHVFMGHTLESSVNNSITINPVAAHMLESANILAKSGINPNTITMILQLIQAIIKILSGG